jgi:iron(II)-dependent oxidoreductase
MIPPQTLGALSAVQELLIALVERVPADDVARRFAPELEPLGWLLGRAVYLETYWLREIVGGDPDLTRRVRHIFAHDAAPPLDRDSRLPPKEHLLNWALEIQDTHLTRLANPQAPSAHAWLKDGWLPAYLVQVHGRIYERMLAVLTARALAPGADAHRVVNPLRPRPPAADTVEVTQGHYRIGAREGVVFDDERPAQIIELASYRIGAQPVSNAEYLGFMEEGGYTAMEFWDADGRAWLASDGGRTHPWSWRSDAAGRWFDISINGPADLPGSDPVMGINQHEARAYAAWVARRGGDTAGGAVVQHEYQWEVAARLGRIQGVGRAWEWCANVYEPYAGYLRPEDPEQVSPGFDGAHGSLRGGCLHTQPALRRATLRRAARAHRSSLFAGTRLVFPPD